MVIGLGVGSCISQTATIRTMVFDLAVAVSPFVVSLSNHERS